MTFKDLKVTIVKVEGPCSRSKVGTTFFIKNAKLEILPGQDVCIFALGSILQPLSAALIRSQEGEGEHRPLFQGRRGCGRLHGAPLYGDK